MTFVAKFMTMSVCTWVMSSALGLILPAEASARSQGPTPPPINISPLPPGEQYGDWTVKDIGGGYFFATTANNAGSVFGTACGPADCTAILNPGLSCDPGASYPALISTPAGAFSARLLCVKLGDVLIYSFDIDGQLTEAMSIGGVIGVAFPMASGEFKVSRFSLTGAARSTARIQQLSQNSPSHPLQQNVSDESTL